MLASIILGHVVCLCLSSSSDDHRPLHSCLGTGTPVETQKQVFVFIVHLWFTRYPRSHFALLVFFVGAGSRYCHFLYRVFGPLQPWQALCSVRM